MKQSFKNANEFVQKLQTDKNLINELQSNPEEPLKNIAIGQGEVPDTKVYRVVVASLVITVIVIVVGLIVMVVFDKAVTNQNILTIFTAIASTAIGALAGVLMPVQKQS